MELVMAFAATRLFFFKIPAPIFPVKNPVRFVLRQAVANYSSFAA